MNTHVPSLRCTKQDLFSSLSSPASLQVIKEIIRFIAVINLGRLMICFKIPGSTSTNKTGYFFPNIEFLVQHHCEKHQGQVSNESLGAISKRLMKFRWPAFSSKSLKAGKDSQQNNDLVNENQRIRNRNKRQKEWEQNLSPWGLSFLVLFVFLERFSEG